MTSTMEELLAEQHGVVRPEQVGRWLTADEVRREVLAGRWASPHRGVVVAHNGPLTLTQRLWAALAAAPPRSALSGLTAAALDGLQGFSCEDVHVVIPYGARKPSMAGLRVTWSVHLDDGDVHPSRRPRRTRTARSVVDAASAAGSDRRCRALLLAGVQQRLVRPSEYVEALERRGPCRRRALIVECADDAAGGIASVPEHDFEVLRRRHGLPEPTRQSTVCRSDGHYYLDVEWKRWRTALEIHGTQHLAVTSWDADLDRIDELTVSGRRVLQVTSYAVRHRQPRVAALVAGALRLGGWRA